MTSQEEVVKLLRECIDLEKKGAQLYSQFLGSNYFLKEFSPEDGQRLHKALRVMAEDSLSHQKIFEKLLIKAEGPGTNVR